MGACSTGHNPCAEALVGVGDLVLPARLDPRHRLLDMAAEHVVRRTLAIEGITCPYHAMLSNGGISTFDQAIRQPLGLIESGPSGGVVAASNVGRAPAIGRARTVSSPLPGTPQA